MHTVAMWEEWGVPVLEPKMVTAPLLICLVSTLCVHLPIDTVCYMCPWWEVPELVSVTFSLSRSQHLSTVTINNSNFPRWWGVKWHEVFRWGPSAMGETHGKLLCVWISELLREKKKCSGANQPEEMGWISCSLKRLLECLWTVKQCLPLCWQHRLN